LERELLGNLLNEERRCVFISFHDKDLSLIKDKVVITYTSERSTAAVEDLVSKIQQLQNGSSALSVKADLSQLDATAKIVDATTKEFGHDIDILVNNAGIEMVKSLSDLTPSDFDNVFNVNVRATFFLTQSILPHLRAPGRIINVTSVGARGGYAELSAYCASKAAVEGFTRSLAMELGEKGHTVNAVEPGPTATEMIDKIPQELVERQKSMTAVGRRLGSVEDVALIVAWLAEEQSRWVSGQSISASGGFSMM
jgi:3-oxoacyl-[acyl-carrier protein] reductase